MPVWNRRVNLSDLVAQWKDGQINIGGLAEKVKARLKESGWRELTPYPDTFDQVLDLLDDVRTEGAYINVFEEIYDLADSDRVWIEVSL